MSLKSFMLIVLQVLCLMLCIVSRFKKEKSNIIIYTAFANITCIAINMLANLHIATITAIVVTIRTFVCYLAEKYDKRKLCIVTVYLLLGMQLVLTVPNVSNYLDIAIIFASVVATVSLLHLKEQGVRVRLGVSDGLWMLFNCNNGLIVQAINSLIGLVVTLIATIKYRTRNAD